MPPGMRQAFAYILLIASLCLALFAVDKILTEGMIALGKVESPAQVTKKETTKGRNGVSYFIGYEFEAEKQKYQRKALFGLLPKNTKIRRADFESLPEGSDVDIVYSKRNPAFNLPVNDPYRNDKLIFILLGVLVFGFVSFNEFKNLRKRNQ